MVLDVIRNFGVDYIYFDLIFIALFLFLLIKFKKKIPLIAFFVGGFFINFFVDWGIWLHTEIREILLPQNFLGMPIFWGALVFFLWFSLSYGAEYAYIFLMFQKKSNKIGWTALVFSGWILIALISQLLPINDVPIMTLRHMSSLRFVEFGILIIGYSLLFILKYDWKKIVYLFFIGFLIHFMMEFS
jgi:phosphatidylserine synthase